MRKNNSNINIVQNFGTLMNTRATWRETFNERLEKVIFRQLLIIGIHLSYHLFHLLPNLENTVDEVAILMIILSIWSFFLELGSKTDQYLSIILASYRVSFLEIVNMIVGHNLTV